MGALTLSGRAENGEPYSEYTKVGQGFWSLLFSEEKSPVSHVRCEMETEQEAPDVRQVSLPCYGRHPI